MKEVDLEKTRCCVILTTTLGKTEKGYRVAGRGEWVEQGH